AQEGAITTVDAQRRLLAWALLDRDNHLFLFLHHTAIPIQSFSHIYSSLLHSRHSFVAMADDPTAYPRGLAPLVPQHKFARSSKWVAVNRPHATAIVADSMFYRAFKLHCPGTAAASNTTKSGAPSASSPAAHSPACRPDEHYIATFLRTVDPDGVANFTITHEPHMTAAAAVHARKRAEALQRMRKRRQQQQREEGDMRRAGVAEGQGGDDGVWQGRREVLERVGEWEEVEYGAMNIASSTYSRARRQAARTAAASRQHEQQRRPRACASACTRGAVAATPAAAAAASAATVAALNATDTTTRHCSPYPRPAPSRPMPCPAARVRSPTHAAAHEQVRAAATGRAPAAYYALGAAISSSNYSCLRHALLPVLRDSTPVPHATRQFLTATDRSPFR
ncbi:unnamed protein product, partial [Closterium sp. Naga37s-1]